MTRRLVAEFLGTLFLIVAVVGTGIMGMEITQGNAGLTLFVDAFATGLALYLLITVFGPLSGAHFNPAVTFAFALTGRIERMAVAPYIVAQIAGAVAAIWLTHAMFDLPILQAATTARGTPALWLSEVVATFGLLMVIYGGLAHASSQVPALVAAWIAGAYWFTSSSTFANPAVTIARTMTDSFAGILPAHAPAYIAAQMVAAVLAALFLPKLFSN